MFAWRSFLASSWLAVLLFQSVSLAGTPLLVTKDGVNALSEPKKDAAVVRELKKGTKLESQDRKGMFWAVKLETGELAYVGVTQVQRLAEDGSDLANALREAALAARKDAEDGENPRARSAVMGVRGLTEGKEQTQAGSLRPDNVAVYRMEDRVVPIERIQTFQNLINQEIDNTVQARSKGR